MPNVRRQKSDSGLLLRTHRRTTTHGSKELNPAHKGRREFRDRTYPALLHGDLKLGVQDLEHALDAGLPEGAEPPQIGSPNADGLGAERERLDDVGAAAESAVDEDGNSSGDDPCHFRQALNGG